MYPSRYERFAMYEPKIFERYAQMLGISNDQHLVFYDRGRFSGMLFSSRCYWLFKVSKHARCDASIHELSYQGYGHEKLSLLNGVSGKRVRNNFKILRAKNAHLALLSKIDLNKHTQTFRVSMNGRRTILKPSQQRKPTICQKRKAISRLRMHLRIII